MPLQPLEIRLSELWPTAEWKDLTVLLAVSGGTDSVALARAMAALKSVHGGVGRLYIGHYNHKLRDQADDDERFVIKLSKQLGLACETASGNVAQMAADSGQGIELAARRARHAFLQDTAGRIGARFVVTAHTADDQAETILHRIIRGTGIAGLAGITRSRCFGHASLIRPMLSIRRREIEEYLQAIGQTFREDQSNTDRRFTRNRIRHELLPHLARHYNSNAADALLRIGSLAAEAQNVIENLVAELADQAVNFKNTTTVEIDAKTMAERPRYLLRELCVAVWRRQSWPMQAMGFVQWDELAEILLAANTSAPLPLSTNKKIFPGNIQVEISNGLMYLNML
jgi:tRNA(Ile)-lysidine synthase